MDRMNTSVLADKRIGRLMFKLTIPAFMGMFVMTLYNVIDTIFIGHYVGTDGIAGLSIVFPIQMLAMGMGMLTGMGGASVVSRLIGAQNVARAERALGNALCLNIILSTVIMVVGLSAAEFWLGLVGASETIMPYALDYMTFILVGMIFQTFSMANNGLITSEGNARVAMMGMVIGAGSNIVLDALFIIPLDMGIKGAAIATTLAHLISAYLRIHLKNFILELGIIKDIMIMGVSALGRTFAGSLSAIFVNRALAEYGGDYAISTFGILNRIMMFATMPGMVVGHGLQPILGYNFGAKRYDLALKSIKIAMTVSTSWCIIAFFLLYFVPAPFIQIFSSDTELIEMASSASRNIFLVLYLMGLVFTGSMVFMAIGKAKEAFITSITQRALFLVPLVFILPPAMGIDGVWLSFPVSDGLSFILTLALLIPVWRQFKRLGDQSQESLEIPEKSSELTMSEIGET